MPVSKGIHPMPLARTQARRLAGAMALALVLASTARPATAGRVVLVGVDGASWNRIDELIAEGALPHLSGLIARGVAANLSTVEPLISPTVWATVATGRSPEAHGIEDFYVGARDLRVPTVFERLARQGLAVGLYDWLVTWPPQRFPNGFVIPGWLRRDPRIEPPDAFARAGVEPYVWNVDRLRSQDDFVAGARRETAAKAERFVRLMRAFDLDVAATTYYCVDATSHRFWRAGYPDEFAPASAPPPDRRRASVIRDALVGVDRGIGEIVAALGPADALIVVSDHGFQADPLAARPIWVSYPTEWLAIAGIEPAREPVELTGFGYLAARVPAGPKAERELTFMRLVSAFASAKTRDGQPLLRVEMRRNGADEQAGATWSAGILAAASRAGIGWLGPPLDVHAYGFVVGMPRTEVLESLGPEDPVVVGGREVPLRTLMRLDPFSGAHAPTAVFVAAGGPFRAAPARLELSVLDIAPLVFHLAGQPVPSDLARPVRTDLLDPAWLAEHPPRVVPASQPPGFSREDATAGDAASDAAVTERLRALGYVR